jgi:hypothetical protein
MRRPVPTMPATAAWRAERRWPLPRVIVFGGLLSDEECDALIAAAARAWRARSPWQTQTGGEEVNDDRTSDGMFFDSAARSAGARPSRRALPACCNWPMKTAKACRCCTTARRRIQAALRLLRPRRARHAHHRQARRPARGHAGDVPEHPEKGGGTTFPDVFLEVAPQRGNAVFFSYERPTLPPDAARRRAGDCGREVDRHQVAARAASSGRAAWGCGAGWRTGSEPRPARAVRL